MNAKLETKSGLDRCGQVGGRRRCWWRRCRGFYYYADESLLLRVLGAAGRGGVAVALVARCRPRRAGRLGVHAESRTEVRKVVWPTRKETDADHRHRDRDGRAGGADPVDARHGCSAGLVKSVMEGEGMAMRWYVVHAYSGFENQVKRACSRSASKRSGTG